LTVPYILHQYFTLPPPPLINVVIHGMTIREHNIAIGGKGEHIQWHSQTKMVAEANQFILLMIGAIRME